jgi:plasmid maintenance system antidote protein VapI
MDPRAYWAHYVDVNGGPARVSERLGIPFSTIAAVSNGTRGIGKDLAQRLHQADPMLDPKTLVWVTRNKAAA